MKFENFNNVNKKETESRDNHRERNEKKLKRDDIKNKLAILAVALGSAGIFTAPAEGTPGNKAFLKVGDAIQTLKTKLEKVDEKQDNTQEDVTISWEDACKESNIQVEMSRNLEITSERINKAFEENPMATNDSEIFRVGADGNYVEGDVFDATFMKAGEALLFSDFGYSEDKVGNGGIISLDYEGDGSANEIIFVDGNELEKEDLKSVVEELNKNLKTALENNDLEAIESALKVAEEKGVEIDKISNYDDEDKKLYSEIISDTIKEALDALEK